MYQDTLWSYKKYLPVESEDNIVSLGEGKTPLIDSYYFNNRKLYYKLENMNPTGSMKDRAISVGLSKGLELCKKKVAICSTGGAALSMAAYCSRTPLKGFIFVPDNIAENRINLISRFGLHIIKVSGTIEECFVVLNRFKKYGVYDLTTTRKSNPYQAEAAKTIAYECFDSLGEVPDWFLVPVGGGGTLAGIWKGFKELQERGETNRLPRMISVQIEGYNSLQLALKEGVYSEIDLQKTVNMLEPTVTNLASNITQIYPPDGLEALKAIRSSRGKAVSVNLDTCIKARDDLAKEEGIYAETSSAVVFSAFQKLSREGIISPDESTVLCITGSGFREELPTNHSLKSKIFELNPDCSDEELSLIYHL